MGCGVCSCTESDTNEDFEATGASLGVKVSSRILSSSFLVIN
jgi:hypothetical protein